MSRLHRNLAWKLFERSLSLLIVLSFCLLRVPAAPPTQNQAPAVIELGKPIERSIDAGETQSYTVTLTAGQYAYIVVDQRGVDVVVSISAPDGTKLVRVDMPKTFSYLKKHAYKGYCSMEFDSPGDPYQGTVDLIETTLKYLS